MAGVHGLYELQLIRKWESNKLSVPFMSMSGAVKPASRIRGPLCKHKDMHRGALGGGGTQNQQVLLCLHSFLAAKFLNRSRWGGG